MYKYKKMNSMKESFTLFQHMHGESNWAERIEATLFYSPLDTLAQELSTMGRVMSLLFRQGSLTAECQSRQSTRIT